MRCRQCQTVNDDDSIYCKNCGLKLKKTNDILIPKPRLLTDGTLLGQVMYKGHRVTVKGKNFKEYKSNVLAIKTGKHQIEIKHKDTLAYLIQHYIDVNNNVLSPSTIRGYYVILKNRFTEYDDVDVERIDFQKMVNDEAKKCSEKTLHNSWGLVSAAMTQSGYKVPNVHLPKVPPKELPWLDFNQIQDFLKAIYGLDCELSAILALHSLRMSEILALTVDDIYDNKIHISKSVVPDPNNKLVLKDTNKTLASSRTIPIMIPRLLEILPSEGRLVTLNTFTLRKHINSACKSAGLPEVGMHGLRRSFASLGYHLKWSERSVMSIGGWSNMQTVHKVYIKLSRQDVNRDVEIMKDYYNFTTENN